MKNLGVRVAVLALAVLPSVAVLSGAGAHASPPNNTGTTKASTHSPSAVFASEWTDPDLIGNGGRRLG